MRSVHNLLLESMIRYSVSQCLLLASFALVTLFSSLTMFGQAQYDERRSPEEIMASYGSFEEAVLKMSRSEWSVVSKWDGFDTERHLTILHEHRDSFAGERARLKEVRVKKIASSEDCQCWVEPDESYFTMVPPPGIGGLGPNEIAWDVDGTSVGGASWNVDAASAPLDISLDDSWSFDLYGASYNEFFVNTKGQISFGTNVLDWTPTGFPAAEYNQIAGYWQDTDMSTTGEIKWKRTADAIYVNYINVGYWQNNSDLTNSFQIIITHPGSGILPDGANAQVCYLDMNWAHGDVGGSGACCGDYPGVTGADGADTNPNPDVSPHVQFGRFNLLDDTYNGPYGDNDSEWDGINWLDYKFFNINTAETNNNLNPVATANLGCDTVSICLGQEYNLDVEFLGPEPGQLVNLEVTEDIGGNEIIGGTTVTGVATASYEGLFVGNEPGISNVTMTAVDEGGAQTLLDIVIQVLDVQPPSIEVVTADGGDDFGICAGAELGVVASSVGGQEPVVDWSWNLNANFWDENTADIPFGGTFVVTGETASGCVVKETFQVFQTPFYLPTLSGTSVTICPGDSAVISVVPDEDEVFVEYEWVGDWNGGGGTVLAGQGTDEVAVTAGTFQLTVTDEGGCQGKRTFLVGTTSVSIPDFEVDPICDGSLELGFDSVEFAGGYASPAEGNMQIQMVSSSTLGWGEAFLQVIVTHEDGTQDISILDSDSDFESYNQDTNPELALVFGDTVQVTFFGTGNPALDANFAVYLFNCVNNCNGDNGENCSNFEDLVTGEVLYLGPALCEVQEALGTWSVDGPDGYSFSNTTQFNTTFYPEEFGLYELCFQDGECAIDHCFEVEVNLPPTIAFDGDSLVWTCDEVDQLSLDLEVDVTDPAGVAIINWPFPGNDNVLENEYTFSQYASGIYEVTATNGCGEAADQVVYTAIPEPVLENDYLCGEGATLELDPIAGDQNSGLVYEWTYNGNEVDDVNDNEWDVDATGSYCVTVPNEGCPNSFDESDCAFIDIVTAIDIDVFLGGSITDCDGGGIEPGEDANLGVNPAFAANYADYTVTWPDGTATTVEDNFEWVIPEESELNGTQICVTVEDPYGCEPQEACGLIFIGDDPTWDPLPIYDGVRALCPGQPETFDLNADFNGPPYSNYSWTVQCTDTLVEFSFQNVADLVGEMFPPSCWGYDLTLLAQISNPCLPQGLQNEYDVIVEQCEILPPNVFTPRDGNDQNNGFHIMGLDPWEDDPEGVLVRIFDRWGNRVYENENYRNAQPWYGDDSAEGVYFYTILLPNGEEFTGTVNIFRSR